MPTTLTDGESIDTNQETRAQEIGNMEERSSTSKPTIPSTTQSSASDIKSPTSRPLYSSKLSDQRTSAPEASAPPQPARQPPVQQKAWTSNRNPITGRSQIPQNKQFVTNSLREGQRVRIVLNSGAEFEGIYSNGPESSSCRLTMVQQKKLPNSAEIANGPARREQPAMTFQRKEITEARIVSGNTPKNDGRVPNGNRASFRTDAAISNSRLGNERNLKAWVPDAGYEADGSLEKPSGTSGAWDQFAENERLFGLKTDYDENIYTTAIDRSHPQYKERVAAAERKAREIERSVATTAHVAEERVMDFVGKDDQGDEEDKYSGVRRQDFPPLTSRENKYTPPARRAPTGQATVKGAPVDPAIISSQLKSTPTPKPPTPKATESTNPATTNKPATLVADKPAEPTQSGTTAQTKAVEGKPDAANAKTKDAEQVAPVRPTAGAARAGSQMKLGTVPSATSTVERDVLVSFRTFASNQRSMAEKVRTTKAKVDKEVKLTELKKFAQNFKLSTPVPKDLISIIAKDPAKQKQIQDKAYQNVDEINRQKEAATKEKETAAAKENHGKAAVERSGSSATAGPADTRSSARPTGPQHSGSATGIPGRHPGARSSYNPQPHHQYNRSNRPQPHLAPQNQQTGNLAQRLRNVEQQKLQHPHLGQHPPPDMRLPPTGPANNVDPSFGRRISGIPPSFLGPKLNPNSHEFRPNAFAQPFNPTIPSQGSSPRSSVNNITETPLTPHPPPAKGQLIRRKTKAIDVKKCFILSHIESIRPPPGRHWDENDGIRPSFDTLPTWRQLQEETEAPDSTMHLTYKEYFERLPLSSAAVATPNPTHVVPQIAHQHQLPFHLQHGAQNLAPRQSPHMQPMQMHGGQHGHGPHVPYNNPDDHRMMHSNSAQSFASPRMGQVTMAYPQTMNAPVQLPYGQPVMQQYVNAAPQMGQYRSFSHNPQFMAQQPHHMGAPLMVQPQFIQGPNGMVATGPMYPGGHPQFIPTGGVPQPIPGSNGFPSPGRPVAPMMAHQGSHQGQQAVYGMNPGMPYQQPAYTPQQPQGKFSAQRP